MTKFKHQTGNKGVPEPKDGYEQCKVAQDRLRDAELRGWKRRIDDGIKYEDLDWVLCERKIKTVEITITNESGEHVNIYHPSQELPPNVTRTIKKGAK